ncbi:MAG: FtsX-like permease family protein, partial [bacterium]
FTGNTVDRGIGVVTLAEARRHPLVKPILQLMGAAVIGLLAIVCANIASILLARGHARRGEMGVRIALGASPRRIGRQVLTECALLGIVALPCGILIGSFCAELLANLRPALPQNWVLLRGTDLLAGASFDPNVRVLVFGSIVAAVATVLFGIGPAVAASRVDAKRLIATSGDLHATAPVRGKQVLVVSQVALATILLISAGLLLRSLGALLRVDLGFRADGVVTLALASSDTSASARIRRRDLITHLSSIAGIIGVATAGCVPFDLACVVSLGVRSSDGAGGDRPIEAELHGVSSGYFRTMGIPLVGGRVFADEDTTIDRTLVVISEGAARQLFGNATAIGRRIAFDQPNARPMDVIGVVRDVRFRSVDTPGAPAIYTLSGEETGAPRFTTTLFVRTNVSGGAAAAMVAREIRSSEAPVSVTGMRTMTEIVRAETSTIRFVTALLLGFAVAALALAGLGVYGVVAYTVSQRTKELGLRLVLGADDRELLAATLARGALLVAIGLGSGVV